MTVLARLEQEAEEATTKAARLNRIVELARELGDEGLSELAAWIGSESENGNTNHSYVPVPVAPGAPRGRKAVRIIVSERPGIWTYKDLRDEMQRRDWFTTDSGLEAAVKRLCDSNREGRRIGKGRYVFPANHGEEDAIESDRSDGALIPHTTL